MTDVRDCTCFQLICCLWPLVTWQTMYIQERLNILCFEYKTRVNLPLSNLSDVIRLPNCPLAGWYVTAHDVTLRPLRATCVRTMSLTCSEEWELTADKWTDLDVVCMTVALRGISGATAFHIQWKQIFMQRVFKVSDMFCFYRYVLYWFMIQMKNFQKFLIYGRL